MTVKTIRLRRRKNKRRKEKKIVCKIGPAMDESSIAGLFILARATRF